jgi:hypothetical protein
MMLHAGLDLSHKRLDVCLLSGEGELVEQFRAPCDRDRLYGLRRRVAVYDMQVRGVIESMNGAPLRPRRAAPLRAGRVGRRRRRSRVWRRWRARPTSQHGPRSAPER